MEQEPTDPGSEVFRSQPHLFDGSRGVGDGLEGAAGRGQVLLVVAVFAFFFAGRSASPGHAQSGADQRPARVDEETESLIKAYMYGH